MKCYRLYIKTYRCMQLMLFFLLVLIVFPMYSVTGDSVKTGNTQYPLNDPRNPHCPCHKYQQLAEKEYALQNRKNTKIISSKEIPSQSLNQTIDNLQKWNVVQIKNKLVVDTINKEIKTNKSNIALSNNKIEKTKGSKVTERFLEGKKNYSTERKNKSVIRQIKIITKIKFRLQNHRKSTMKWNKKMKSDGCFSWN